MEHVEMVVEYLTDGSDFQYYDNHNTLSVVRIVNMVMAPNITSDVLNSMVRVVIMAFVIGLRRKIMALNKKIARNPTPLSEA